MLDKNILYLIQLLWFAFSFSSFMTIGTLLGVAIHDNIVNSLSCFCWQEFIRLAPEAQPVPVAVPHQLWELFNMSTFRDAVSKLSGAWAGVVNSQLLIVLGHKKFNDFLIQLSKVHPWGSPCPTDEWSLCLFVTFMANSVQHYNITCLTVLGVCSPLHSLSLSVFR